MAISLMLVNDGFNETQKRQFEALCLCGAAEKIFERDPEGKTIRIERDDVLEAWGIFNEFFEFASVNLNRPSRTVLNAIPLEGDGKPQYSNNSEHFDRAQNHDWLVGANEIADSTGIGIKRVYEIVQSRASGGERVGPLHDNELIQSVKYPFDRRTVYWLTEKGVKAKRAKREAIHLEGDDRTTLYEPQMPAINSELLDAIPGYSGLFRTYSGVQSGHSESSAGLNPEIKENNNICTISFRGDRNTDIKSFFPEQEVPPETLSEKKLLGDSFRDSRTQNISKASKSPDNGTELEKSSELPDSRPESTGKRPNELDSETIREAILTSAFRDGQKVSLSYAVSLVAATIRRRYPNAGRDLEDEISRLTREDPELQMLLAEHTETEHAVSP